MQGQRITHTYNNVSLSDALSQLAEQQTDYAIMFLYNELEDFRITTTVSRKSLPDAIQQMIGFYPIRTIVDTSNPKEKKIFVEWHTPMLPSSIQPTPLCSVVEYLTKAVTSPFHTSNPPFSPVSPTSATRPSIGSAVSPRWELYRCSPIPIR